MTVPAARGLVLAGGAGTRLRPLTYSGAKQLVPVANRPILFYVIDNLVDAGIRQIGVIISPQTGAEIRTALGDGSRFGAELTYIEQSHPGGLAHAVKTAQPFLADAPFVMYLGDNLIGMRIANAVATFLADSNLSASLMLKEVDDPRAFGVAIVDDAGHVIALEEKPRQPRSRLALVGIYCFRPTIFAAIDRIQPSARGELEITDAISNLIDHGARCCFTQLDSWWLDTGKKDDLLRANDTVLDDWLRSAQLGTVDAASEIIGRVHVAAGAKLIRSRVRGPAIIGEGAQLIDAVIGPFTAIGPQVTIERSRVEHSVLMEGTQVRDIPRLEDSLIGRRVVVAPGRAGAGALALLVGDDCMVELAKG
jgi:glucose-1-phosphate thymidylyltransferase